MDFEIRADRKPQGPRKLARERAAYLQLVSEGHSYSEACRIVGVNAKTGRRWRNGRNPVGNHQGAPPLTAAEVDECFDCFDTEDFRIGYAAFLAKQTPQFVGK